MSQTWPDRPLGGGQGPLAGLKVVEFAHVIAGPIAGTLLADLGADVVHVESVKGDPARYMGPTKQGVPLWWKVLGRNKRSVTADLRTDEGKRLAWKLVEWAEVAIVTFRAETVDEFGLGTDQLHELNPDLVILRISGYGVKSTQRDQPGFGKMGEARSGVVHLTGFPDGPPVHTGFSHGDAVAGLMGAFAVMAALYRRSREATPGQWIDLALFEPLFRLIEWQIIVEDQLGTSLSRSGNQLAVAPAAVINTYKTGDDQWLTITSATPRSVEAILRLLNLDSEISSTTADQPSEAERIDRALAEWVRDRPLAEGLEELKQAKVVAAPILSAADILQDEAYAELQAIAVVEDPELGSVKMQNVVPRLFPTGGKVWRTGPPIGYDNDTVFGDWLKLQPGVDY